MSRNASFILGLIFWFAIYSCASTPTIADDSKAKVAKENSSEYAGWIGFGWLGMKENPVLKMKLPPFMVVNESCDSFRIIDGIRYCMTGDYMLWITGVIEENGKEIEIDLSGSVYDSFPQRRKIYKHSYEDQVQLEYARTKVSYRKIEIDGHPAHLFEDASNRFKEGSIHKYRVVLGFEYSNLYGDIVISVGRREKSEKVAKGIPHSEWSSAVRSYIDRMINSIHFMIDVKE